MRQLLLWLPGDLLGEWRGRPAGAARSLQQLLAHGRRHKEGMPLPVLQVLVVHDLQKIHGSSRHVIWILAATFWL